MDYQKYQDMLYRIAFSNMKNKADAEDAVQEAFLRYVKGMPVFADESHERAWFIRTVINICIDIHKNAWNKKTIGIDAVPQSQMQYFTLPYAAEDNMLWRVMNLPALYQNPLYLFYYEDYSIKEIAGILDLPEATVKTRLKRGREEIKNRIRKEGGSSEN